VLVWNPTAGTALHVLVDAIDDLTAREREDQRAEQRANLERDRAVIESIRERGIAAVKGKRVELHVSIEHIAVLVKYAGAGIKGYAKLLEREVDR
jgi:hypothetical protein